MPELVDFIDDVIAHWELDGDDIYMIGDVFLRDALCAIREAIICNDDEPLTHFVTQQYNLT